jgi:hypothetical protein
MKREIFHLIEFSTVYGLPNIFRSRRLFNKLFWLTFLVLSMTAASLYIFYDLVDYFNYEVVTTVKTEYDQPTEFPTVSFCTKKAHLYDSMNSLEFSSEFSSDSSVFKDPENHYESFISPYYGKCFRFNSGKNMTNHSIPIKNSTSGGEFDFYRLNIYAPYGLLVWIQNKSSIPKIHRKKIHLSPGLLNYIEVERTFESKLEEPYNNCLKDVSKFKKNKTLIDYFLNRSLSYSLEKCLDFCFDLFYIQENPCECKESELGNVFEECWLIKEKASYSSCTWKYRTNFTKNDLVEKCSDYCPLECDSMSFSYSISYNRSDDSFYQVTEIYVYYRNLKYTSITQQAKMKWAQLISNLGGYLSLFVGLSFVSLLEITEIFMEIVFILSEGVNSSKFRIKRRNEIKPQMRLDNERILIFESELEMHKKENKEKLKELADIIENIQKKIEKK